MEVSATPLEVLPDSGEGAGPVGRKTSLQPESAAGEAPFTEQAAPVGAALAPEGSRSAALASSLPAARYYPTGDEFVLVPVDPSTGEPLPAYPPIALGHDYRHALSLDGRTLAVAMPGKLLLVDLHTWKHSSVRLVLGSFVSEIAFDPAGRRLAIASGSSTGKVTIFDLESGKTTGQSDLDFLVRRMKFTADGGRLMVYGAPGNTLRLSDSAPGCAPAVALLDPDSLAQLWPGSADELSGLHGLRDGYYLQDGPDGEPLEPDDPAAGIYYSPGLVFAPDRDALYIVHAEQELFTTVDFAARKVTTVEIRDRLSWLERFLSLFAGVAHAKVANGTSMSAAISPDGRRLYVVGRQDRLTGFQDGGWEMETQHLGLQVLRTSDGSRVSALETEADEIALDPQGTRLFLIHWGENHPWTEVFDTQQARVVARLEGSVKPAFRSDGSWMLSALDWLDESGYQMGLLDPRSLEPQAEWVQPQPYEWLGGRD